MRNQFKQLTRTSVTLTWTLNLKRSTTHKTLGQVFPSEIPKSIVAMATWKQYQSNWWWLFVYYSYPQTVSWDKLSCYSLLASSKCATPSYLHVILKRCFLKLEFFRTNTYEQLQAGSLQPNAKSIINKFSEFQVFADSHVPHLIAITESWCSNQWRN